MKTSSHKFALFLSLGIVLSAAALRGADLTWDADAITVTGPQDGAGTWTTAVANTNWWNGSANVIWSNTAPDNAIFGAGSGAAGIVTIASGITNNVGNVTYNAPGSGSYTVAGSSSTTSRLNLVGTPTFTVASSVSATNTVAFTGTSFTKLGAGTLVLRPGANNANAGATVVGAGTLFINSGTSGRLVIPGNLTITNGAIALLGTAEQIADSAVITVDNGTYDSGGKSETIGGFVLDNNGQVLSASSSQAITNNGATYDLRSGFFFPNLAGLAGLTKTTAGTVVLTNGGGSDTFAGQVLISDGTLELGHSGVGNGLPATTITITNTGVLRLGKDTQIQSNATVNVAGATFELNAHNEGVATVILNNNGSILNGGNTTKTLTILTNMDFRNGLCASKLGGAGLLTKSTAGTVTLTVDNANTGGVLISAGILQLGDGSVNRGNFGTGSVTNNSVVVLNHSGAFTIANNISGSGSVTNLGGSATLTGTNTYTGNTVVLGGTLFANNTNFSSTGSGSVTVAAGATLGGNGIVGGPATVQSSGTLAPGANNLGTLIVSNTLTLGGSTAIQINKGVGFDVVTANSVNYGGTLAVADIGLNLLAGDTFQIFNAGSHANNFASILGSPGVNLAYSFDPASGVLSVVSAGGSPTLNVSQSGSTLTFSWTDSTFKLQSQTNALTTGLANNWSDFPGGATSPVIVTIDPTQPTVFFRLMQNNQGN